MARALSSSLRPAPSYLPRTLCSPGTWDARSLPSFGPPEAGGQLDTRPGHQLISEKGFQAKPRLRDKRPSVHLWVPSPGFPEQHSFMPARPPRPAPRAPALRTLLPFTASGPACLFVVQRGRLSVVLFSLLNHRHPPSKPSLGTTESGALEEGRGLRPSPSQGFGGLLGSAPGGGRGGHEEPSRDSPGSSFLSRCPSHHMRLLEAVTWGLCAPCFSLFSGRIT